MHLQMFIVKIETDLSFQFTFSQLLMPLTSIAHNQN